MTGIRSVSVFTCVLVLLTGCDPNAGPEYGETRAPEELPRIRSGSDQRL